MSGPILVFGAAGQVGAELLSLAARRGISAVGIRRSEVDITEAAGVRAAIAQQAPRLIVNAAAYTAVDRAESEPGAAWACNVEGPAIIAAVAAAGDIPVLHLSSDYVFDGSKDSAYVEEDAIAPLGVYGRTKAEGEARVAAAAGAHIILRTSWVYGTRGTNFLNTMLRLARERDELRVVADQIGYPTSTLDIAEAVLAVDKAIQAGLRPWGLYHFAGSGQVSWHGFAEAIVEAQAGISRRRPVVTAIATANYPTAARRPANSRLNSSKFMRIFGYKAPCWRDRLAETMRAFVVETEDGR